MFSRLRSHIQLDMFGPVAAFFYVITCIDAAEFVSRPADPSTRFVCPDIQPYLKCLNTVRVLVRCTVAILSAKEEQGNPTQEPQWRVLKVSWDLVTRVIRL